MAADEAIRAVLRKTAHLHYSKQSAEKKAGVRKGFFQLDTSKDGKISLAEFLQSTNPIIRSGSGAMISNIFNYVDDDKSGFLELDEYIVFTFIMEAGFQVCNACMAPIIIAGYTCNTCWGQCNSGLGPAIDSFDLCASCYASDSFSHSPDHELVPTALMYHQLLTSTTSNARSEGASQGSSRENDKVQCCICNDYHVNGLDSALVDGHTHVTILEDSSPSRFICEWCACYMCKHCGTLFNGASFSGVRPSQWLRNDMWCGQCEDDKIYYLDYNKILELLEKDEVFKRCTTCAQKRKDKTLVQDYEVPSIQVPSVQLPIYMDPINQMMANNLQVAYNARRMQKFINNM